MNNGKLVEKISANTGVHPNDCAKVLAGLEEVLEEELANSSSAGNALDKIYKLISYFNKRRGS
ncbi:hypothetical protein [Gracilibacillus alcaliphilus]|uniref:hypothetical protein n=1 Tax=Gracilibacillus alcaliphilus TaxID=1401441 RepID=UPI001957D0E0|nr:hypothetical protein [Gracilibacillus alcaliphilus]MBM7675837.1 hypothetical protein [Gracilibacillus alcaliphilus]